MLRSVKYGLYGAVLAGVVGGTVAWTNVDKNVILVVDGSVRHVQTTTSDVGDAIRAAGYTFGAHDIVAPSSTAAIHEGSRIVLNRGRLLRLDVNGVHRDVWTTAPTVADALVQLGYSTADFTSVSRSRRLPLDPTDISVRTPRLVTVVHDGKTQEVTTTDATVGELLSDLNIMVRPTDQLSQPAAGPLTQNDKLYLRRVSHKNVTKRSALAFATENQNDPTLAAGETRVIKPGKNGLTKITYAVVYIDGRVAGRTRIKTVEIMAPVKRVVKVGTKARVAPVSVTPGSAQDIARRLVAARGWSSSEFSCLVTLWNHESGWRVHAANPSGAYGIPQALPGSKMSSAGSDWQNSATTQIQWGLSYIASRYNTPCGAWSSWQSQGSWY